ncbi:MAG TPA: FtsX-like permease family protein, partial [Ktedonobacterales bacterium]|nr:FtsX-like permease family protein [Ktedonobacterales bacterium]
YIALMSNDGFLAELQQLANAFQMPEGYFFSLNESPTLYWYYHLNVSAIGINQVDDLIARLQKAQTYIPNSVISGAELSGPPLGTAQGTSTLERFSARISLVAIPVTLVLLQVVGLLLFFVGMIASLLVERQADVIAILRSRGASQRQIVGAFVTQSLGLALLALLVGPLLAISATRLLVNLTLASADQQAQQIISGNPVPTALTVSGYALVTALCAVVAMVLALYGSTSRNVLEMRRESARSTRQPLWQRVYLDVIVAVIALTGFLFSLYVTNAGALDAQASLTIATPLALVAPLFLAIAGMLLFLRGFPWLLRRLARLSSRRRGVSPMLALALVARAPRQAVRMILLLALASSFAGFALVFIASETQHLQAVAAYEAGADFSGVPQALDPTASLAQLTAAYRAIPGVTSATPGFAADALEPTTSFTVSVRAVDASTFAQTAIWTEQDSSQPLAALMRQLLVNRPPASANQSIPALVDALTWQKLNLHVGASFSLQLENQATTFTALAEVAHIPTINDTLAASSASDFTAPGGILVDYQSLTSVMLAAHGDILSVNYVWLRTSDDPALLARVRAALTQGPLALATINDRRATLSALEHDPLYLALLEVLAVGTATTMLLALIGNLIAAWLSARTRLINFAMLRALGTTPRQLASILGWEQVIVYITALALGALFGALLAVTIVPGLVFTGLSSYTADISSGAFYALQHILPTQVVVPGLLVLALAALVVMGALAIGLMARVASKPAIIQMLRLNPD